MTYLFVLLLVHWLHLSYLQGRLCLNPELRQGAVRGSSWTSCSSAHALNWTKEDSNHLWGAEQTAGGCSRRGMQGPVWWGTLWCPSCAIKLPASASFSAEQGCNTAHLVQLSWWSIERRQSWGQYPACGQHLPETHHYTHYSEVLLNWYFLPFGRWSGSPKSDLKGGPGQN